MASPAPTPRPLRVENPHFQPRLQPLLGLAERILGCPDLAEEAVQEALIALWQTERVPRDPQGWLTQAVVHRSLTHLRSLGRRRTHECRAAEACRVPSDPAEALERAELREVVASAIAELPAEFRVPLELYEVDGLDYAAIARREQLPVGTVRSRIHRARRRLRERLASEVNLGAA